jgi:ribonuclease HI
VVTRWIWLRRNELLYEGSFSHPVAIIKQAETVIKDYNQAQSGEILRCNQEEQPASGKWTNPQQGWYKVNFDAAVDKQGERIGLGTVIRNHLGDLVAMKSLTRVGLFEPIAAEALAAAMAVQLAQEMGLSQINMEGDAKMITEAVRSNAPDWSKRGHLIDDIRYGLQNFTQLLNHLTAITA